MERGNGIYQDHYNLPLPSIENFAYNEQANVGEHYNYDYSRTSMYGYRNVPENVFQLPGQHYQNYGQQVNSNQHQLFCNPMYQQQHSWAGYETTTMIPSLNEFGHGNSSTRARHKRSRMSLQKRLLVNARERERMRVLNKAFEVLRDALPCYIADGHMAKITTLRLAINYIKALTEVLEEQRELDLEREKNKEEKQKDKHGFDKSKIIENEEISTNGELDENIMTMETSKHESNLSNNS